MKDENSKINEKDYTLIDALKLLSPGTSIRTALDDILRARMGALILIEKEGVSGIIDGGFRINARFSAQRLVELAKMDGGIILSNDLKKITYANTLLVPKVLKTTETGTRHKAAERASTQLNTIVIAVSERKNKITVYCGTQKHILEQSSELLRRATETLQILERQKDVLNDSLLHLNILEITNLATTNDVCIVLQRMEMVRRISDKVKRYLVELGKEGIIVSMRLKELTKNLHVEREMILKDYFSSRLAKVRNIINNMNFDFLLETSNISRILFEELDDRSVSPRGERILFRLNLIDKEMDLLIGGFVSLDKIFEASSEELSAILDRKVDALKNNLDNLKEKILEGKKI